MILCYQSTNSYNYLAQIQSDCTDEEFNKILINIDNNQLLPLVDDLVIHHIEEYIRQSVAPIFWKSFTTTLDEQQGFNLFKKAVDGLYTSLTEFLPILKRLHRVSCLNQSKDTILSEDKLLAKFKLIVRATLLAQLPLHHEYIIEQFYKIAFNVFCNTDSALPGKFFFNLECPSPFLILLSASITDTSYNNAIQCGGCNQNIERCQCQMIVYMFHETNRKLIELELLERLVGNVLTSLIHVRIKSHVSRSCDQVFDISQLIPLENVSNVFQ